MGPILAGLESPITYDREPGQSLQMEQRYSRIVVAQ